MIWKEKRLARKRKIRIDRIGFGDWIDGGGKEGGRSKILFLNLAVEGMMPSTYYFPSVRNIYKILKILQSLFSYAH